MSLTPDRIDPVVGWRMWFLVPPGTPFRGAWAWGLRSPFAPSGVATAGARARHVFRLRRITQSGVLVRALCLLGGAVRRRCAGRQGLSPIVFDAIRLACAGFAMCHRSGGGLGRP